MAFAAENGLADPTNNFGALLFHDGDLAAALPCFRQAAGCPCRVCMRVGEATSSASAGA